MQNSEFRGRWAVVTGASSGLGVDFARELALRGVNTVLVARRREPMEALAEELRSTCGVSTEVVPADLTRPESPRELHARICSADRPVSILVNNAGFGVYGPFLDQPIRRQLEMIDLNVRALVELTHLFAPAMVKQRMGRILQVASVAGFVPIPRFSVYAAGKAFVISFSESINHELRGSNVTSTVLCPGTTRTAFFEAAGHQLNFRQKATMMPGREVAAIGIRAMLARKRRVIPGFTNRLIATACRWTPRRVLLPIAAEAMRSEPAKA